MEILLETIDESQQASRSGKRAAEDILVKIKSQDGSITEVPILMLIADLFTQLADVKLRLAVVEAHLSKKDSRIISA
jgi:hypothetical protein